MVSAMGLHAPRRAIASVHWVHRAYYMRLLTCNHLGMYCIDAGSTTIGDPQDNQVVDGRQLSSARHNNTQKQYGAEQTGRVNHSWPERIQPYLCPLLKVQIQFRNTTLD